MVFVHSGAGQEVGPYNEASSVTFATIDQTAGKSSDGARVSSRTGAAARRLPQPLFDIVTDQICEMYGRGKVAKRYWAFAECTHRATGGSLLELHRKHAGHLIEHGTFTGRQQAAQRCSITRAIAAMGNWGFTLEGARSQHLRREAE